MMPPIMQAVVIGASAGAFDALSSILPSLPIGFRLPVMVVVHLPPDKRSLMAELFRQKCLLPVEEAEDKQPIVHGTIYFAPPDYHLLVERGGTLSLSKDDPILFSRPSIDVLFESASDIFGTGLIAVVLTGANEDGAKGLRSVEVAGGTTIIQDPKTAFVPTMPEAALRSCPGARILTLEAISLYLREV